MRRFRGLALGARRFALGVLLLTAGRQASAATIDRIAALVDRQVLTVSEISQLAEIRFFPRAEGQTDDDYRKLILDSLIAQALRFRDVERFGAADVSKDAIEARLLQIQQRFASPADIQERFAPMIFVSTEEIENYYRGPWTQQRRQRGLSITPLSEVQDEIRTLLRASRLHEEVDKWTAQLRSRANVDIYAWR
jgi:hypothetical protein